MKFVVCIKYTPPPIGIDSLYYANPYDLYALHCALTYKRCCPDVHVTALSMAPDRAIPLLKNAVALGCDEAVLISDKNFAGSDTIATSYVLCKSIKYIGSPDFVLCGEKSMDGETGFVGIGLAECLHYTYISDVISIEKGNEKSIIVKNRDAYYENTLMVDMPAVLSCRGVALNEGTVSLQRQKLANRYNPIVLTNAALKIDTSRCGLKGSFTKVLEIIDETAPAKGDPYIINEKDAGADYIIQEIRGIDM